MIGAEKTRGASAEVVEIVVNHGVDGTGHEKLGHGGDALGLVCPGGEFETDRGEGMGRKGFEPRQKFRRGDESERELGQVGGDFGVVDARWAVVGDGGAMNDGFVATGAEQSDEVSFEICSRGERDQITGVRGKESAGAV